MEKAEKSREELGLQLDVTEDSIREAQERIEQERAKIKSLRERQEAMEELARVLMPYPDVNETVNCLSKVELFPRRNVAALRCPLCRCRR